MPHIDGTHHKIYLPAKGQIDILIHAWKTDSSRGGDEHTGTLVRLDKNVRPPARLLSIFRVIGPIYRFSNAPNKAVYLSLLSKTSLAMFFRLGSLSRM